MASGIFPRAGWTSFRWVTRALCLVAVLSALGSSGCRSSFRRTASEEAGEPPTSPSEVNNPLFSEVFRITRDAQLSGIGWKEVSSNPLVAVPRGAFSPEYSDDWGSFVGLKRAGKRGVVAARLDLSAGDGNQASSVGGVTYPQPNSAPYEAVLGSQDVLDAQLGPDGFLYVLAQQGGSDCEVLRVNPATGQRAEGIASWRLSCDTNLGVGGVLAVNASQLAVVVGGAGRFSPQVVFIQIAAGVTFGDTSQASLVPLELAGGSRWAIRAAAWDGDRLVIAASVYDPDPAWRVRLLRVYSPLSGGEHASGSFDITFGSDGLAQNSDGGVDYQAHSLYVDSDVVPHQYYIAGQRGTSAWLTRVGANLSDGTFADLPSQELVIPSSSFPESDGVTAASTLRIARGDDANRLFLLGWTVGASAPHYRTFLAAISKSALALDTSTFAAAVEGFPGVATSIGTSSVDQLPIALRLFDSDADNTPDGIIFATSGESGGVGSKTAGVSLRSVAFDGVQSELRVHWDSTDEYSYAPRSQWIGAGVDPSGNTLSASLEWGAGPEPERVLRLEKRNATGSLVMAFGDSGTGYRLISGHEGSVTSSCITNTSRFVVHEDSGESAVICWANATSIRVLRFDSSGEPVADINQTLPDLDAVPSNSSRDGTVLFAAPLGVGSSYPGGYAVVLVQSEGGTHYRSLLLLDDTGTLVDHTEELIVTGRQQSPTGIRYIRPSAEPGATARILVYSGEVGSEPSQIEGYVALYRFSATVPLEKVYQFSVTSAIGPLANALLGLDALPLADGSFIVAATPIGTVIRVFHLTAAGALDPTFNGGGGALQLGFLQSASVPGGEQSSYPFLASLAVTPDGTVVVGYSQLDQFMASAGADGTTTITPHLVAIAPNGGSFEDFTLAARSGLLIENVRIGAGGHLRLFGYQYDPQSDWISEMLGVAAPTLGVAQ